MRKKCPSTKISGTNLPHWGTKNLGWQSGNQRPDDNTKTGDHDDRILPVRTELLIIFLNDSQRQATLAFSKHSDTQLVTDWSGGAQRLYPLHRAENLAIMELAESGDQNQVEGEHRHVIMSINHSITVILVIQ